MFKLRNLVFICLAILIAFVVTKELINEPCTEKLVSFLIKLQEGNSDKLIHFFGQNTCNCQPRGGYKAFFCYESGEDDNLSAFLRQKFNYKILQIKPVSISKLDKSKVSTLPWEQPEDVNVDLQLDFDKSKETRLYFLPLDMAFGYEMKIFDFKNFINNPEIDFSKKLALRLRPSLENGLLIDSANEKNTNKAVYMADVLKEILSAKESAYLKPRDPGLIKGNEGQVIAAKELRTDLPRLKSIKMRIYMGRRGLFQRWFIKKCRIYDPVLTLVNGKDLNLHNDESNLDSQTNAYQSLIDNEEEEQRDSQASK